MTDRGPGDEEDQAWLLARERGELGQAISDDRVRRYAQLSTLMADLPTVPAGVVQRTDWEQAVLAAIAATAGRPADQSGPPPTAVTEASRPKEPTASTRGRRRTVTTTAAVFAMVAACAAFVIRPREPRHGGSARSGAPDVDPEQPGRAGLPEQTPEVTRGMHVEQGRLGFDHTLQLRRSEAAGFRELRDGDTVMAEDRIRVSVTTSVDAYLYLAFCKGQHLQMYPSPRGVRTAAGRLTPVPEGGGSLIVDSDRGPEELYLIFSQDELSLADPRLAELIAAASDGTKVVDCGASLDIRFMKSTAVVPPTNLLRGERVPKKRMPRSRTGSPKDGDLVGNPGDIVWYTADEASEPGTIVAADTDGVAVVRYRFTHVAPERSDDVRKTNHD